MTPKRREAHPPIDNNIAAEVLYGQSNCAPLSKRGTAQDAPDPCTGLRRRHDPHLGAHRVRNRPMAVSVINSGTSQLERRWSSTPFHQPGKARPYPGVANRRADSYPHFRLFAARVYVTP